MKSTKCITVNKTKMLRFIFAFFFYFPFFYHSLQCFSSKISRELLDLEFLNLVQTLDMTSCTVYKKIQPHIAYQSFYFVHFSFFPINVVWPLDGYHRGYVSFAHFLLYFSKYSSSSNRLIIVLISEHQLLLQRQSLFQKLVLRVCHCQRSGFYSRI